ncbi:uncharacterized protein CDV56_103239 [Aspergillus thermomutatus]|uniref:Alpha/beta hydrolase fold-3 domain-containing protein n=1 Tax=Aspergillus thermomutatus TaxID=41047 RepID=A0A397G2W5_ASPTH|nr:uncharacterized protein CDV56_103239 [Aspergillus thermomutatus]RHZ45315.1 hypothetical protein CDV56_103239 [Aspergillus thermomutatus]
MGVDYYRKKSVIALLRILVRLHFKVDPHPDEVLHIPSRDVDRTIKVHIYKSSGSTRTSPVLINACDSGFTLRAFGIDDEFCRSIAQTGYTVVDVKYRLAPEHPFPAAFDDIEDVVKWVRSQPARFDQAHISLSGFSAGANLALAVASSSLLFRSAIKGNEESPFHAVVAFYPSTDLSEPSTAKKQVVKSKFMIRKIFPHFSEFCHSCYRNPREVDMRDPRLLPSYADPARFPKNVLIITTEQDPFTIEGEKLAEKVRMVEGHNVVCHRMEGCSHGWDKEAKRGTKEWKAKEEAYGYAAEMLKI